MAGTPVSALVAAYNEEEHLGQCLQSLLAQSYSPLEIIVVDDGSTDGTLDVARRYASVKTIAQPHQGKARCVNLAAQQAQGAIVLFLDGDMFFDSAYVEKLVAPILAGVAIGTCHGTELVANPKSTWSKCLQDKFGLPRDRRLNLTATQQAEGSVIFRAVNRDAFLSVNGFDDTGHLDDQTLYPKLGRRAVFVSDAVCHHYNPERLGEVFASGIWGGKSSALRHGRSTIAHYSLPFSLPRAIRSAWRLRNPAILIHDLTFDLGAFYGVVRLFLGIDRGYGK